MSTTKQITPNRRHAQDSGCPLGHPRSAEAKTDSITKSFKTGLYARSQLITGEDPAELHGLAREPPTKA